jgi:glycosyltransferase involved in cell wall biosynthesis
MALPYVSLLVDTYDHERFIEEAIASVMAQDFPRSEMEIVVVDDGSTDRTPEIVRKFGPQVRLLRKANGGQASAFNAGIPETRGEIVAFLDGDDWWAKNKLTRVAEAMRADPDVGIVGHGILVVRDGDMQSEVLREGFRFRANTLDGARLFRQNNSAIPGLTASQPLRFPQIQGRVIRICVFSCANLKTPMACLVDLLLIDQLLSSADLPPLTLAL